MPASIIRPLPLSENIGHLFKLDRVVSHRDPWFKHLAWSSDPGHRPFGPPPPAVPRLAVEREDVEAVAKRRREAADRFEEAAKRKAGEEYEKAGRERFKADRERRLSGGR